MRNKLDETDRKIEKLRLEADDAIKKNPKQEKAIDKKYFSLELNEVKDFVETFMREKGTDRISYKDLDSLLNGDSFNNPTAYVLGFLDETGEYDYDFDDDGNPYFRKTKGD